MKIWIIASVLVALVVGGFFLANALQEDSEITTSRNVASSSGTCDGSCTSGNSCGSATCGVEKTESCGCGRK